jgi:peptidoglycan/xylan/chitin deacetylase (PgdA/CDA1 family)
MYHDIVPPDERDGVGFPGPLAGRYKLDPDAFRAHLDAVARTGVEIGLVSGSADLPPAAISFDDGGGSAVAAAEELESRGWRGHFFVTTGRIGSPGFLDEDGVRELARRGHAVGSHSVSHPTYMGRLTRAELDREWRESRERLSELLGEPPATASVPGGFLSSGVIEAAAAAGYEVLMTSEPSSAMHVHDGLHVLGRYTIRATTPPARAAAYVRGARLARARLWLSWNAKQLAKRVSPGAFEALRRRLRRT